MKILADTHTHTIASTHAYSTVMEMARAAADAGLEAIAVTDHGMKLPDAPHSWHFHNLKNIPREICGVKILYGIEANILDLDGNIDPLEEEIYKRLDIVNASIHSPVSYTHLDVYKRQSFIFSSSRGEAFSGIFSSGISAISSFAKRESRFLYSSIAAEKYFSLIFPAHMIVIVIISSIPLLNCCVNDNVEKKQADCRPT